MAVRLCNTAAEVHVFHTRLLAQVVLAGFDPMIVPPENALLLSLNSGNDYLIYDDGTGVSFSQPARVAMWVHKEGANIYVQHVWGASANWLPMLLWMVTKLVNMGFPNVPITYPRGGAVAVQADANAITAANIDPGGKTATTTPLAAKTSLEAHGVTLPAGMVV